MSIDLKKLENKLDEALSNETNETLTKFLTNKRMSNYKQSMKLYTEEQLLNTAEAIKNYYENSPDTAQEMVKKHLKNLAPLATKRTLIVYNTKETTEDESSHLLEILNCDDSTLWDNADHCGVQVLEVPIQGGNNEQ